MRRRNDDPVTARRPGRTIRALHAPRRAAVFAVGLTVACLLPAALAGAQAENPAEPQEQSEQQAVANPIESNAESRAIGRQRYVFMCRECHGNRGRGDGDMAHAGGVPSDFTDDVWDHGESDGEIFAVIKEGVSADMQGYANRLSDEEIWHVVNYIKSLSR